MFENWKTGWGICSNFHNSIQFIQPLCPLPRVKELHLYALCIATVFISPTSLSVTMLNSLFRNHTLALARVAQWVEHWPANQKVPTLISQKRKKSHLSYSLCPNQSCSCVLLCHSPTRRWSSDSGWQIKGLLPPHRLWIWKEHVSG